MAKNILLGTLVLILSSCSNMPGQQLCVCTDDDYTKTPPVSVPPPPVIPEGYCPCPVSKQESQKSQEVPKLDEQAVQPTPEIPSGHTCPVTPSTCQPAPTAPCQCQCYKQMATPVPSQQQSADKCRFDSMPIKPNMHPTEKLNRTR